MDAVNWLLINVGEACRWLIDAVVALLGAVFGTLDTLLNPVLSPLLRVLNPICNAVGDAVFAVLAPLPPSVALAIISGVAGVVMLLAFRYTSNQAGIGRAKDEIKANLLALKLYKDEMRVTFVSQWRLFKALGRFQWYMLKPVLVMLVPMLLALAQMGVRYQWRPMAVGGRTMVTMAIDDAAMDPHSVALAPNPAVAVEVGPVAGGSEIAWRIRAQEPGRHTLRFTVGDRSVEKELVVDEHANRVSFERPGRRWTAQLLHPIEPVVTAPGSVRSITVHYPDRQSYIHGADYWVLTFFVVSMLVAIVLKPVFKVRF